MNSNRMWADFSLNRYRKNFKSLRGPNGTKTVISIYNKLGCPENAKSLKSQAPQGFSGCLDIENDEMNKKNFLSASPRVN